MHQEPAYQEFDGYGYEWEDFVAKDLIDRESFERRRFLIDTSETFQEDWHCEMKGDLENWLRIHEMDEGQCLKISSRNLKKYVDPYELTKCKKTQYPPDSIILSNIVSSFLPEDKNLVFDSNGTFISQNSKQIGKRCTFETRERIINECFDIENECDFKRGSSLLSWYNIGNMKEGELLYVSDANLKKLVDLEYVLDLIKDRKIKPYQEYIVLSGLLASFLPEDKKLAFSSNLPHLGTFITN